MTDFLGRTQHKGWNVEAFKGHKFLITSWRSRTLRVYGHMYPRGNHPNFRMCMKLRHHGGRGYSPVTLVLRRPT